MSNWKRLCEFHYPERMPKPAITYTRVVRNTVCPRQISKANHDERSTVTPSATYWDCDGNKECKCELCFNNNAEQDAATATSKNRCFNPSFLGLGVSATAFALIVTTAFFIFQASAPGYSTPAATEIVTIPGLTHQESDIARFLLEQGLSPLATAAVMGNMYVESRFDPAAIEQGEPYEGRGLMQWSFHPGRRQQLYEYTGFLGCELGNLSAINAASAWTDKERQLEFLWAEMTGQGPAASYANQQWPNGTSFEAFTAHTDLEAATNYFGTWFLRHNESANREVKHTTAIRIHTTLIKYSPTHAESD